MKRLKLIVLAAFAVTAMASTASAFPIIGSVVLTPSTLDFPNTRPGNTSAVQSIVVTKSLSFLPVFIFDVVLASDANFTIVNDGCSGTLLTNFNSCTLDFTFTPSAEGIFTTSVTLIDTGRQILNFGTLVGQGVAPEVTLSRTDIDYGDVIVGGTDSEPVTVTNTGTDVLNITSIVASGTGFSITGNTCGATLNPGDSCGFNADFSPGAVGNFTGDVTITDDASDSPQVIPLSGTGILSGPDADVTPTDIDFPDTVVGSQSTAITVTVQNDGDALLTIATLAVTTNFLITNDLCTGAGLAPAGGSCTFDVVFAPGVTGLLTGTVTITDDASDSPQVVFLSGNGINPGSADASLSANDLDFGEQEINTIETQTVTVTNTGNEPLDIESIILGGLDAFAFALAENCSASDIPIGESCTITVTFGPTSDGTYSATITITSNGTGSPQTITLTGTGIGGGFVPSGGGCALTAVPTPAMGLWLSLAGMGLAAFGLRVMKKRR